MAAATDILGALTPDQEKEIHEPSQKWSDDFAGKVARQDFQTAEQYRQQNHDWRYRNADELYFGWQQQKYWEGTRYPRSSLAVFTCFQQIESILPSDVKAAFGDQDPIEVDPEPGTNPDEARAVRDLILWQIRQNAKEPETAREVYRKARKSAYLYGNGVVETGWTYSSVKKTRYRVRQVPVTFTSFGFGGAVSRPTGKMKRIVEPFEADDITNGPFMRFRQIQDCYVDPNCPGPIIQMGKYFAIRELMSIEDLLEMQANDDDFTIPDEEILIQMAKDKPSSMGDQTKTASESYRNVWYQPTQDSSSDPGSKRIEVIRYWTGDRYVWLGNRTKVFYNQPNKYGVIPCYSTGYVDVLGHWYCISIPDVVEGDQRLQASILNARVDELALAIHPDTIKRRGVNIPQWQVRRRPGLVLEAENPKEDVIRGQVQNVTAAAWQEVEASERRSQKTTGITDLAVLGSPSEGGNSANRTATGINTQRSASGQRIEYGVENCEDQFIEPLLRGIHSMNQTFLDPNSVIDILGDEGKFIQVDPLKVMNADVKFRLRGAARMGAKQALSSNLPMLLQTLSNPELMQQMAQQQGMTLNVQEIMNMVADVTGYKPRSALFVPMTDQQKQQMNQPPPADLLHKQMQDDRLSAQAENTQTKGMMDAIREIAVEAVKAHLDKGNVHPQEALPPPEKKD
jgi:hypothetical protein